MHETRIASPFLIDNSLDREEYVDPSNVIYKRIDFKPNCFRCSIQGRIDCAIHVTATVSNEMAVRHLEVSLHPFVLSNMEKYFVCKVCIDLIKIL